MKEEILKDIEKCVLCGICKAVCPTHAYSGVEPQSARGRMLLLHDYFTGSLKPSNLLNERLYSCTLCGLCEPACPLGVGVTEAVYRGRSALVRSDRRRRLMRAATKLSLKNPNLSFRTLKLAFSLGGPLVPRLLKRSVPFGITLPDRPLRDGQNIFKPPKKKGRVALFTGCSVNYLYPELGASLLGVLLGAGYEVVLPPGEVCCGEPMRALGLEKEAIKLAKKNLDIFGRLRADAVVSLCPTCVLALRVHYASLLGRGVENAMDVTEFLHDKITPISPPGEKNVAYHNPCHLGTSLGVKKQPLSILRGLGHDVTAPAEPGCCGFSTSLWDAEVSNGLLEGTLKQFGNASTIVTACPGCMMQLGRRHPNVKHIIETIAEGTAQASSEPKTEAA
jgi:glycolate oxidase iron-sulfur subunit